MSERELICPYCKTIIQDEHEFFSRDDWEDVTTIECYGEDCGKEFVASRSIDVFYSTKMIDSQVTDGK